MNKINSTTYNIYQEELEDLTYYPESFFDKLLFKISRKASYSKSINYVVYLPASDYLRGELFCTDVSEEIEEEFTQTNLVRLLLDDFLEQAKRKNDPKALYYALDSMDQYSIQVYSYGKNGNIDYVDKDDSKTIKLICKIKRKEALRLEVMLSDIADLGVQRTFSVEDVLRILYIDFITKYKQGKIKNIYENTIKRLNNS